MKNPLRKRLLRELRSDFGKYLVIFLFMILLISLVSGFLIADHNFKLSYDEGFTKYNMEDGHITFSILPTDEVLHELEEKADLQFYEMYYQEETVKERTLRIYKDRQTVNTVCLMQGAMPSAADEIALDRMFAKNNEIQIGDTLLIHGQNYQVTGFVALPDYSCLFYKNTDMMFDAINFGVAIMTEEGYDSVGKGHEFYNYAWKYQQEPADETEENQRSEEFLDILEEVLKAYAKVVLQDQIDALYDQAEEKQQALTDLLETAGDEIEETLTHASEDAARDAIENQSPDENIGYYMVQFLGLDEDEAALLYMEDAADKLNTTTTAMIADEIGTTEEILEDMLTGIDTFSDMMDEVEDATAESRDLLDEEDPANNMDFSLEDLKELIEKIEKTGIYDTSEIMGLIEELEELSNTSLDEREVIEIDDYIPRYLNNAINFTGEDMGSDAAMFSLFNYLVIIILAFIFAVTTSNTIAQESAVIGTLRASGYTRGELVRHYLILPMLVTLLAALIGNILGYTVFTDFFVQIYYNSYSLATFERHFNLEAFVNTTIVPILIMFAINYLVLSNKMKLSPLKFLRKDLSRKRSRHAVHLSSRIPFLHRFRLRILLQNFPAYLTMMFGIILGAAIVVFGTMFMPLLDDYAQMVRESELSRYQYVLKDQVETSSAEAEKYCMTGLNLHKKGYMEDEVSVYGIKPQSSYVKADIPENTVLISNSLADKYSLQSGEVITLEEKYTSDTYMFIIGGIYDYDAGMAVFMNRDQYLEVFEEEEDYFTGYFSNQELTDIEEKEIASVITEKDLTKMSDQLKVSFGDFMGLFDVFGVIMFLLLMYLLTRQIIEKNMISISMTKILGFKSKEIAGLYLVTTSIVVLASLLISIPLIDQILRWAFHSYIYTMMTGYIPYIVDNSCYVIMVALGIVSYLLVSLAMMFKISHISKSESLKTIE